LEITLEKSSIETLERILDAHIYGEETSEAIVPDALPDILRITDADAELYIRAKELQGESVVVSGIAEASVLYASEGDAGVFVVESDIPFSLSAKCPGASGNEKIVAQTRLAYLEATLANPRKIFLKAEIAADIAVYRPCQLEFSAAGGELPADCEILTETIELLKTVSVREKTFSMSFENDLPPSLSAAEELMKTRTSVIVDESKGVGTKAIVKGRVKTDAVFAAGAAQLLCESFETPFSQILETDCPAEDAEYSSSAFLTGTYYELDEDSSGKLISGEIHMAVQTVSCQRESVGCIKDMYSTRYPLECRGKKQTVETQRIRREQQAELSGKLSFTGTATRLGDAHALCGRFEVSEQNGTCILRMQVNVSACCYSNAGEMLGGAGRFELETELQTEGMKVSGLHAEPGEVRCAIAESGIDFSVRIVLEYELSSSEETEFVLSADCPEDKAFDNSLIPSVLVIRVPEGKSIWSLAKENRSSPALIYSSNPELEPDGDNGGKLILIPKAK